MEVKWLAEVFTAVQRGDVELVRANEFQVAFAIRGGGEIVDKLRETVEWALKRRVYPVIVPDGDGRVEVVFWLS